MGCKGFKAFVQWETQLRDSPQPLPARMWDSAASALSNFAI